MSEKIAGIHYEGDVRMHCCTNNNCYPPTWFSESEKPENCPDCNAISRIATPEEEHNHRKDMSYPSGRLSLLFLLGDNRPQSSRGAFVSMVEKALNTYKWRWNWWFKEARP